MLTPASETVFFLSTFTTVIAVTAGTDTAVTSISTVTASFNDPGVTVAISGTNVVLSGTYNSILPITWYWKDLTDTLKSARAAPAVGTFDKIVKLDSPATLSQDCIYTIVSDAGSDTFTHTVQSNYDSLATELKSLLANQPGVK